MDGTLKTRSCPQAVFSLARSTRQRLTALEKLIPKFWKSGAVSAVALLSLSSCAPLPTGRVDQVGASTPVVLGAGDVVKITFTAAPEYNQAQKIRSDGKVSLPQIGEVTAAGKTVAQFESQVRAVYSDQMKESEVSVTVESAATQVYVTGAVRSPGKQVFDRPMTILQAIMEAGGPNQFGNVRSVRLIRTTNGVHRTQIVDLHTAMAGQPTNAMYVKNGDIIQVPQSPF